MYRHLLYILLSVLVVISFILHNVDGTDCSCRPISGNFNESLSGEVGSPCPKCYFFQYPIDPKQDWVPRLCVQMHNPSDPENRLYVIVRESTYMMSFHVPMIFPHVRPYLEVCRTLCPVNSFDNPRNESTQNITVEISSSRQGPLIGFSVILSTMSDFIILENETRTVNITPTMAHVLQYNMEEDNSVRIEAYSEDDSCMLLAIQAAECPIYDSVDNFELQGYYQTFTHQAGIDVKKTTYPKGRQYIVVFLLPTDEKCVKTLQLSEIDPENRVKEVTIKIVPSISNSEFYLATGITLAVFLIFGLVCILINWPREKRSYTYISDQEKRHTWPIHLQKCRTLVPVVVEYAKTKKFYIYISDMTKRTYKDVRERSKSYPRNLVTVAIFYCTPVFQLVFVNQSIVNLTGNQDLCYYNFLCSHQASIFIDFNHIFSNIGYIILGMAFLITVWRRSHLDSAYERKTEALTPDQRVGVPRNYGLLYALGWSLLMEGMLSASYHVCPSKTNFQFDTAFMYVMIILSMVKIYQSRHPDHTPQSHTFWLLLATINMLGFLAVIKGGLWIWIGFSIIHLLVNFYVMTPLYNTGRWERSLEFKLSKASPCCNKEKGKEKKLILRYPSPKCICEEFKTYLVDSAKHRCVCTRSFIWALASSILNIIVDIYVLVAQPENFASILLYILIGNSAFYLVYYMVMKGLHNEVCVLKTVIPGIYFCVAGVLWIAAFSFFTMDYAEWQATPAGSRTINNHCYEALFNFYDCHDVWHLLSSIALYFSFMGIMTLDHDVETTPRTELFVF